MSETTWVLKGVDPTVREKAVEEAGRLGVSLSDYLTDIVVRHALVDQINAQSGDGLAQEAADGDTVFSPSDGPESYAVRHRLRGLERRLNSAVGSLDDALFDLTARVGEVEGVAADTNTALGQTQQETSALVAGLQLDLALVEENLSALAAAQQQRCAEIDRHIGQVESVARATDRSAAILADAHDALKHAVANDFSDFARDLGDRLHTGLAEVRLAANGAAAQADAAIAHLVSELRQVRDMFAQRLDDSAADTRAVMHAAFADAADRMGALAERVIDNERYTTRVTDQIRAQLVDVEDGAQTALEETAETLRQADALIAADLARASDELDAALEGVRTQLSAEVSAIREDQLSQLARLKLLDVAVGNTINDLADARDALTHRIEDGENQVRALLARAEAEWNARATSTEREVGHLRQTLIIEIERVEACANAALEKLSGDIARGDATLGQRLELAAQSFTSELAQVRGQTQAEHALVREEHAGALARLTILDGAIARLESAVGPVDARLMRLEAELAALDHTLPSRVAELEAAAEETHMLSQRLDAQRELINETSEQVQDVARTLAQVAAQSGDAAAKSDARAHQVEMAVADLRLAQIASAEKSVAADLIRTLESRIDAIETAQANAIQALAADIARFVDANDQRLAALERPGVDRDLAVAFDTLRKRVEERILGIEQRSVRTLEQVADTVAMIEERFIAGQRDEAAVRSA